MATRYSKRGESIEKALVGIIEEMAESEQLPTVRQLMHEHSASQTTIMKVLDNLERRRMIVRRSGSGLFVAPKNRPRRVLMLVSSDYILSAPPFCSMLMDGLRKLAEEDRIPLEVVLTPPGFEHRSTEILEALPQRTLNRLTAKQYSCLVCICMPNDAANSLAKLKVPTVSFGCVGSYIVQIADDWACHLGVLQLKKMGCKTICAPDLASIDLYYAFKSALDLHHLKEVRAAKVGNQNHHTVVAADVHIRSMDRIAAGFASVASLVKTNPLDGLLIFDDVYCLGAMMALESMHIEVGKDIHVATTANVGSPLLLGWHDRITRLHVDVDEICRVMWAACHAVAEGVVPTLDGWDNAIMVRSTYGQSFHLNLRPQLVPQA